eukprot:12140957-Alexandrium_andersonii.AAC.1
MHRPRQIYLRRRSRVALGVSDLLRHLWPIVGLASARQPVGSTSGSFLHKSMPPPVPVPYWS